MPPHSPFDASPIGRLITPGIPIVRTGTCGKSLANRNPEVLGRNPGTVRPTMVPSRSARVDPGVFGREVDRGVAAELRDVALEVPPRQELPGAALPVREQHVL